MLECAMRKEEEEEETEGSFVKWDLKSRSASALLRTFKIGPISAESLASRDCTFRTLTCVAACVMHDVT